MKRTNRKKFDKVKTLTNNGACPKLRQNLDVQMQIRQCRMRSYSDNALEKMFTNITRFNKVYRFIIKFTKKKKTVTSPSFVTRARITGSENVRCW